MIFAPIKLRACSIGTPWDLPPVRDAVSAYEAHDFLVF